MCDRTKTEILARELCIEYYLGLSRNATDMKYTREEFIDKYWSSWKAQANRVLDILPKHKD